MPLYFCVILLQVLFENIVLYGFLYFADMSFLFFVKVTRKKKKIMYFVIPFYCICYKFDNCRYLIFIITNQFNSLVTLPLTIY